MDYSGRGELADRQQQLAQMMSKLQKISEVRDQCFGSGCVVYDDHSKSHPRNEHRRTVRGGDWRLQGGGVADDIVF